ncbi:MAG TPA: phosphatase PAP2 family protein [Burkholderiales bacterium]|nr:phosphatase PAP2 family protein [Burkholderiales bacterium]
MPAGKRPHSLSPRALAAAGWSAFLLAGVLFFAIAWNVTTRSLLVTLDAQVAASLHAHATPGLVLFLLAVTHLHSVVAVCVWSAVFAVVLARLGERLWLLTLVAAVGGAALLNVLLKEAYERLRPHFDDPLLTLATYSFPSGHTAGAVAFYGVLAAFLVSRFTEPRRRAACVAGAIAAVALVGFSRIYLGAHYLSDVVAAACSSTAWLTLCLVAGHAVARGKLAPKWIVLGALGLLALATAVFLPLDDWSDRFEDAIEGMSLAEGLIVFCAVSAAASLLLVPAWIFPIVAGAAFGMAWGLAASMASALVSALAAFALARTVLRGQVERALSRSTTYKAVAAAVAREPRKMVALLRMSPLLPSGVKSYGLGLTRVKLADYVVASMAGMLPGIALKVYVGAAGRGAMSEGGALNWTLLALGIGAALALGWLVRRQARRTFGLS